MNLNLVDMIREQLPGDFLNKASSLLGESRDKTELGIEAAIPGVLGGFTRSASTSDGATRLASAVNDADEGILSGIGSMFGRNTDFGTGALRSILGAGLLSDLTGGIGKTSGLSGKGVTTLLGVLAPIVLSVLKRVTRLRGLDASGLANLLSGQRENIASAMPEGMRIGEYANVREPLREVRDETYRAARPAALSREAEYPTEHRRSSWGWILPVALLALLAAGLWHWVNRPAVRAGREQRNVAEETARLKQEPYGRTPMASLETLKTKYSSAIEKAREQGVQISSMTETGGKLTIQGTAPSAEAVERVKAQFRRVNPSMNDVVVNLGIDSAMARLPQNNAAPKPFDDAFTRAKPTAPSMQTSPETGVQTYTVKPGDTLGKISKQFYGTTKDYKRIFDQNKSDLKDANSLNVGQKLEIPAK